LQDIEQLSPHGKGWLKFTACDGLKPPRRAFVPIRTDQNPTERH
jgi:hypothetical protein